MLSDINLSFERLSPSMRQVGYVLLTRAPVASFGLQANQTDAPRLACVKPVASVHPEPGSNSRLMVSQRPSPLAESLPLTARVR